MSTDVSLGLAHEAELRLRKAGATAENFWDPVSKSEELAKKVVAFVATSLVVKSLKIVFHLFSTIDRDMTDWTRVDSTQYEKGDFEPELAEFFEKGEEWIAGEEMLKRAKERDIHAGLLHAEAMFREQEKIPANWRNYRLVFPEMWDDPKCNIGVFYLLWDGDRWCIRFTMFFSDKDFFSSYDYRLVRLRNK